MVRPRARPMRRDTRVNRGGAPRTGSGHRWTLRRHAGVRSGAGILEWPHKARLPVEMHGKCVLNPPAKAGVAGQGGEVEPHESDEVSQGWCERGEALHERGKTGFTVVPIHRPPQHVFVAERKPLRVVEVYIPAICSHQCWRMRCRNSAPVSPT